MAWKCKAGTHGGIVWDCNHPNCDCEPASADVRDLHKVPNVVGPPEIGNSVLVDGRCIPSMRCLDRGDHVEFILDGRLSYVFPKEWSYLAAAFAANAMAIGAGYTAASAQTKDGPFAPEVCEIQLSM